MSPFAVCVCVRTPDVSSSVTAVVSVFITFSAGGSGFLFGRGLCPGPLLSWSSAGHPGILSRLLLITGQEFPRVRISNEICASLLFSGARGRCLNTKWRLKLVRVEKDVLFTHTVFAFSTFVVLLLFR